jgi:hypothetical protein
MHTDRSAILSLVALGRITPREAERLLAVWPEGDESILRLALGLAFVGLVLPSVENVAIAVGQAMAFCAPAIARFVFLIGGGA